MNSKNTFTVNEAKKRMEKYCSYQERCDQEVEKKLSEMNLIGLVKEEIIMHLLNENFLNEERYSKTFARGKFRIKKWGKKRIIRELKIRNISAYNIKSALQEIDDTDYFRTFNELAEKRNNQIKEVNKYKRRKKLADYLAYRGWESDMIYRKTMELAP